MSKVKGEGTASRASVNGWQEAMDCSLLPPTQCRRVSMCNIHYDIIIPHIQAHVWRYNVCIDPFMNMNINRDEETDHVQTMCQRSLLS